MLSLNRREFRQRLSPQRGLPRQTRPGTACLVLCVLFLATAAAPTTTKAQCRTAVSPQTGSEPGLVGTEDDSTSHSRVDFPFWPPRINVSRKDVSWPYARGRAVLSTVIPLAVGGTLLRIRPDNRTSNALGLAVGGAGLLVGPSVGQWCLGSPHLQKSVVHTGARVAGMGGLILTTEWGERQLENAGLFELPFVMLSVGFAIGIAGAGLLKTVAWAIGKTPRLACDETERTQIASVSPAIGPSGGTGVRLAIRF